MKRFGKYNAQKTDCCQGHKHDSRFEANRCDELHLMQKKGIISNLRTQVRYELTPAMKYEQFGMPNERNVTYIADFVYTQYGLTFIEDTKGFKTPEYVIKRKMLKRQYCTDGMTIFLETRES